MVINYDDILHEIKVARGRGKKNTKVKIMQVEVFDDKPNKVYCNVKSLPTILKNLKEGGYQVKDESTGRQISSNYDMNGICKSIKVRKLITRNLIISW